MNWMSRSPHPFGGLCHRDCPLKVRLGTLDSLSIPLPKFTFMCRQWFLNKPIKVWQPYELVVKVSLSTCAVLVELLSGKLPTKYIRQTQIVCDFPTKIVEWSEVYCHFSWAVIGKDRKMFALLKSLVTYESTSTVTQDWPPQAHVYCPCATPGTLLLLPLLLCFL